MRTAITNATLVMEDHYIPNANLVIQDGVITDFGEQDACSVPADARVLDAGGALVGPGLIDVHTHAAGGAFFASDPARAARVLLEHGVTGVLPALYMSLSQADYLAAVDKIDDARARGQCDNILGYYMEGPYLNPKYGCDRSAYPWGDSIDRADYAPLIERVRASAKVWAVAPERPGIEAFARDVARAIPGIVLSVAHSEATPGQIEALIRYGLRLGTHHTNATGTLTKYPECRGVCVDEAVNYRDDIYAELISDARGIHVDPYMLRLVRKIKGERKIILISDGYVSGGPIPPGYHGVQDINFDDSGEIAGSKLTLDVACRNFIRHTGCSPLDAFRYASSNPARLIGLADRGAIFRGAVADLILTDPWMNVDHVILKGAIIR